MANDIITDDNNSSAMPARHRRLVKWLIVISVFSMLTWIVAAANYKLSGLLTALISPSSLSFLLQSLMAIALGILSSICFSTFENKHSQARLEAIKAIGPPTLLNSVLSFLQQKRDQGFVYNEAIEFILGPAKGHDKFLVMRASYSYRKLLRTRDLFFRFLYLKTEEAQIAATRDQSATNALYASSESFIQYPDAHLRSEFGDALVDEAHRLLFVKIDGAEVVLNAVPGDNILRYYQIPTSKDLALPIHLEYAFEFPVSRSDIVFGVAECLTLGLSIKFSRDGAIKDRIDAEAFEIISAVSGNPVIVEDPIGTHKMANEGWVIPKSGAVYHWWPTDE